MKKDIEIICGSCSKENTVKLSNELKCKHCEDKITGKKYIRKPWILIPTTIVVLSGVAGGVYIDEKFETDRYPMSIEHSLIENCISSYEKPLDRSNIRKKKEVCICALEDTISDVSYSEYKDSKSLFIRVFGNKAKGCI